MKKFLVCAVALLGVASTGIASAQDRKPVVAVAEFLNESGAAWWSGGVGWELSGMLSNELASTGDFTVVERNKIETVLSEQNLAASGRVQAGTGAQIGKLIGADYLIAGTVRPMRKARRAAAAALASAAFRWAATRARPTSRLTCAS